MLYQIAATKSDKNGNSGTVLSFIKRGDFVSVRNALKMIKNISMW